MELPPNNQSGYPHCGVISFGIKTPSLGNLTKTKHIADCHTGGIVTDLANGIKDFAAKNKKSTEKIFLQGSGDSFLNPVSRPQSLGDSFVEMSKIPRGLAAWFVKGTNEKFGLFKKLCENENGFVQRHFRDAGIRHNRGALQGIYDIGAKFTENSGAECECGQINSACKGISDTLAKKLGAAMEWGRATCGTKYERLDARLMSGGVASAFMSLDFLNKGLAQGKTEQEAKKDRNERLAQEMVSTVGEGVTQFALLAMFAKAANTKTGVAAMIAAAVGFAFNIISRVATGKKLTRIKAENRPQPKNFLNNLPDAFKMFELKQTGISQDRQNSNKKPILSPRNLLIASGVIILAGIALRFGKKKIFNINSSEDLEKFKGKIIEHLPFRDKINKLRGSFATEEFTDMDEIGQICKELNAQGKGKLSDKIRIAVGKEVKKQLVNTGETTISLGKEPEKTLLFGKIEVSKKTLWELPLAPFRFIGKVISFPYTKLVKDPAEALYHASHKEGSKLAKMPEGIKKVLGFFNDEPVKKASEEFTIKDVKNFVLRFRDFKTEEAKALAKKESYDLTKKFGEYVDKMWKIALDDTNFSKTNNAGIAVVAATASSLSGIPFNMNDEHNKTIQNGGTKEEAQKEARKRGINKFIRTTIQGVIAGSIFNSLFKKQYNTSLAKASLITVAATIATDIACRFLTGMPFTKMSKEQQEAYKEKQKKGIAGWYYKGIDKLSE